MAEYVIFYKKLIHFENDAIFLFFRYLCCAKPIFFYFSCKNDYNKLYLNTICYSHFYTRNRKKLVWRSKDNEKIKIWHHFQNVSIFCKKWRIPPFWNFFTKIGLENFKTAFWIITVVPSIELSTKKTKKNFPVILNFLHLT